MRRGEERRKSRVAGVAAADLWEVVRSRAQSGGVSHWAVGVRGWMGAGCHCASPSDQENALQHNNTPFRLLCVGCGGWGWSCSTGSTQWQCAGSPLRPASGRGDARSTPATVDVNHTHLRSPLLTSPPRHLCALSRLTQVCVSQLHNERRGARSGVRHLLPGKQSACATQGANPRTSLHCPSPQAAFQQRQLAAAAGPVTDPARSCRCLLLGAPLLAPVPCTCCGWCGHRLQPPGGAAFGPCLRWSVLPNRGGAGVVPGSAGSGGAAGRLGCIPMPTGCWCVADPSWAPPRCRCARHPLLLC